MNIETITREVMNELMQEMYLAQASSAPAVPYKRVLIVFNRADLPLAQLLPELAGWSKKSDLKLLAPKWANALWQSAAFKDHGLELTLAAFDRAGEAQALVNSYDRIALIGCTRSLLQKLSRLSRDTLPGALVVEALQRNKPVMILDDSWESYAYEARKVEALGLARGGFSDLARVFPLPPQPVMPPVQATVASAAPAAPVNHDAAIARDRIARLMEIGAQRVSAALGQHPVPKDLASMIDHTLLKPEATEDQVRTLCAEAAQNHFASVCVNPGYVSLCAELLKGSGVMVCTVVGFPLGATDTQTKADETRHAIANGADEIDMVINVGALKSQSYDKVEADIRAVVQAAAGKTVKVILETGLLNDAEKVMACRLSEKAGAHFVKTSTGFGPGGATEQDIALMRRTVRPDMEVKASGGIRDQAKALKMIEAGATRIGASASVAIVKGEDAGAGKY